MVIREDYTNPGTVRIAPYSKSLQGGFLVEMKVEKLHDISCEWKEDGNLQRPKGRRTRYWDRVGEAEIRQGKRTSRRCAGEWGQGFVWESLSG